MDTKIRGLTKLIGSRWTLGLTLLAFSAEAVWLALRSAFPMAFDEGYHFGLIEFFAHRLNPVVVSQPPGSYSLGAIVQNSSFLYHYLMSFPYRLIAHFTSSPETQVICLRLINVALAVAGLLIMRKLLLRLRLSGTLANLVILAFAFTPMFMDLSAQINYDNLLIPAVSLCVYGTLIFLERFEKGRFDTKTFLAVLALCLFSSLIKFAFLPVFLAIVMLVAWKIVRRPPRSGLMDAARKDFSSLSGRLKLALSLAVIAGGLLFIRFYGVDLVKYHSPAPQCNQILSVQDCEHYYAWNNNYTARRYKETHPPRTHLNILQYDAYWVVVNTSEPFLPLMPLHGAVYIFTPFIVIVVLLGALAFVCSSVNARKILKDRHTGSLLFISFIYILFLWGRNYHDYLQLGQPVAIDARYLLPVLIFLYAVLALGVRHAFDGVERRTSLAAKAGLALIVAASFLYYGGFHMYLQYIDPVYGHINSANNYDLDYVPPKE